MKKITILFYVLCFFNGLAYSKTDQITNINGFDDTATVVENSRDNKIDVLSNDEFGSAGPLPGGPILVQGGSIFGGAVIVDTNNTPNEPLDDRISYYPPADFTGLDTFTYTIVDANGTADTSVVRVWVMEYVDYSPTAIDDFINLSEDTTLDINVLNNDDFGLNGPANHAIQLLDRPSNGVARVNNNGTPSDPTDDNIIYEPNPDYYGSDTFTYQICDIDGDCDSALVTLYVDNVDDAPIAVDDSISLSEDTTTIIEVLVNDDFGGDGPSNNSIRVTGFPSNGEASVDNNDTPSDPTDDTLVYVPSANYFGSDTFEYQICDMDGDCDKAIVTVSITNEDDAPIAVDDSVSLLEDATTIIEVLINDDFGGDGPSTSAIQVTGSPSNGEVSVNDNGTPTDPTDDTLVYEPNANYFGSDTFEYQICDVDGDCDTAIVTLSITNEDDAPIAVDDSISLLEDTTTIIEVLINDDFGGDGPSTSAIEVGNPFNGEVSVNDNGTPTDPTDDTLVYVPNANYFGSDTFEYQICDVDGDCDTAIVTVSITNEDDAPIAVDDAVSLSEDTVVDIEVLINDDFGGDGSSESAIEIAVSPLNGVVSVDDNGTPTDPTDDALVYEPNANYFGEDTFEYQICDIDGDCDTAIVTVSITNENDAPIAVDDSVSLLEDTTTIIEVLINDDFGGDGPSTSATEVTGSPLNGVVTVDDNGTPTDPTDDTLVYVPNANYFGSDTFEYQICDVDGDCDTAIVTVSITNENDTPIAEDDSVTLLEDNTSIIAVLINDSFGGDGPSTSAIEVTGPPLNGEVTVNDNGTPMDPTDDTLVYTPEADYYGEDTFAYQICDIDGDCDTAIVRVNITNEDDAPIAVDDSMSLQEDTVLTIDVLVNDDFGGDGPSSLAINIAEAPLNGVVEVDDNGTPNDPTDDTLIYTPDADYYGEDLFMYQICDIDGDCDTAIVEIEITDVEDRVANMNFIKTGVYVDENDDDIVSVGDVILYSFIVENNGDLDLTNITIDDPLPGIEIEGDPLDLAVGETNDTNFTGRYVITQSDVDNGQVSNQAIATGTDPNGVDITDISDDPTNPNDEDVDQDGDSEDVTITLLEDPEGVVVFETFSPNGDGVNDEFVIERLNKYPDNNLQIFNRWGVKVFDKSEYEQPQVERFKGYSDGRVTIGRGETLPIAVYYYTLNYVNEQGISKSSSGSFYLTR